LDAPQNDRGAIDWPRRDILLAKSWLIEEPPHTHCGKYMNFERSFAACPLALREKK